MMLSGRPLRADAADRPYLIERPEAGSVVSAVRRGMNVLVLGERGMGKTTLLNDVAARLSDDDAEIVMLNGALLATSSLEIVRAVVDSLRVPLNLRSLLNVAARRPVADMSPEARVSEARHGLRELTRIMDGRRAYVILDDPAPDRIYALFGGLRDEVWDTGLLWIVAGDAKREAEYRRSPADVFFERVVVLRPLDQAEQLELVRRRLEDDGPAELVGVAVGSGNPRGLLTALRDAVDEGVNVASSLEERARRETRASTLGAVEGMMLVEIEDGAQPSASDPEWLERFGVSRQRAQQALATLEREGLVEADRLPGPNGRPRKVYRRKAPRSPEGTR